MSDNEFEDEDLDNEDEDFEEDEALSQQLDQENLEKFIKSFDTYLANPNGKEEQYLITDNLVTFLDYIPKVKKYEYDGFKELLAQVSTKIETAIEQTEDTTISALLKESLELIKKYLGSYYNEYKNKYYEKYEPKKYQYPTKYGYKYPYKEPKDQKEELAQDLNRDLVYLNKEPLPAKWKLDLYAKEPNPEEDRFWLSVLHKIESGKEEYQQKKQELAELNNKKIELSNKATELSEFRRRLLGKVIDQLIDEGRS
jgi:hypothetical protein